MSDTVKLIMEIPESIFNTIQADEMISREQLAILQMRIMNGIPLDDVKAEIEEKISHYDHFQGSNTAHGLEIALEIIDKHIGKAESEDK